MAVAVIVLPALPLVRQGSAASHYSRHELRFAKLAPVERDYKKLPPCKPKSVTGRYICNRLVRLSVPVIAPFKGLAINYMNTLVADPVQKQEKLSALTNTFRQVSQQDEQESINRLLDNINKLKSNLESSYEAMVSVPDAMRELAWFTEVDQEELSLIGVLLDVAEKHSHKMVVYYAALGKLYARLGLDRTILRQYKEVADEIKEVAVDLRHRFFDLPQDAEFIDLMQQLSAVA